MSEVSICNIALAYLGEEAIRSLTETNRRAGLCNSLYSVVRDSNLARSDWSFARTTVKLNQITEDYYEGAVFSLPSDCITPLNLLPRTQSRMPYKIEGGRVVLTGSNASEPIGFDLYLQYTKRETNTTLFSHSFIDILALDLAVRMCIPLTQDRKMAGDLKNELRILRLENEAEDANRGDEYRHPDENPENDSFVNPPEGDGYNGWNGDRE